jgi:PPK2 family polyphosphate:nucleotide phosphotransferase
MARTKSYAYRLEGETIKLDRFDPDETDGLDKEEGGERLAKLGAEFVELGNLLAFAGEHALLVVLQGRDASGKDGTIRRILDFSNIQTANVKAFKVPTEEELAHDFLWRVHAALPGKGHFTMFNRSHYEDVLAARVHKLVPKQVWRRRFDHINAFEKLVTDGHTILLKFYLHISREEQYERLIEREEAPRSAWKLNPADWREIPKWNELTEAYEDVLSICASGNRPWYLVPANKKWYRNLAVMEQIVTALRPYRKHWERTLERIGKRALKEINELRAAAEKDGLRLRPKHSSG